jgi:hypothetical protein
MTPKFPNRVHVSVVFGLNTSSNTAQRRTASVHDVRLRMREWKIRMTTENDSHLNYQSLEHVGKLLWQWRAKVDDNLRECSQNISDARNEHNFISKINWAGHEMGLNGAVFLLEQLFPILKRFHGRPNQTEPPSWWLREFCEEIKEKSDGD